MPLLDMELLRELERRGRITITDDGRVRLRWWRRLAALFRRRDKRENVGGN